MKRRWAVLVMCAALVLSGPFSRPAAAGASCQSREKCIDGCEVCGQSTASGLCAAEEGKTEEKQEKKTEEEPEKEPEKETEEEPEEEPENPTEDTAEKMFPSPEEIGICRLRAFGDCWQETASGRRRMPLLRAAGGASSGVLLRGTSNANVILGKEIRYPESEALTHYFRIDFGNLGTTGFCGNSSKAGNSGNYPAYCLDEGLPGSMSWQTAAMIKMVMLMYPLFPQNIHNEAMQGEAAWMPLLGTAAYTEGLERRFLGIHAIISYLNSGDLYGLSEEEKHEVVLAAQVLKRNVELRKDLTEHTGHFRLYRSVPGDVQAQEVLWLVPDAHVQIMKTGVNRRFETDSSLCTYAGAEYGVYSELDEDGEPVQSSRMDTITLDADGFGKTEDSFAYTYGGIYYVREEKAPEGYLRNPTVARCRADDRKADRDGDGRPDPEGRGDYIGAVRDKERCAAGVKFKKTGERTGCPVAGARFRIRYTGKENRSRSWIFVTGEDGVLDLAEAEKYLDEESPDPLYVDDVGDDEFAASGRAVFLPGEYEVEEIKAPDGFEILEKKLQAEVIADDSAPGGAVWKWIGEAADIFSEGEGGESILKDPEVPGEVELLVEKSVNRVSSHIGQIQTWTVRTEIRGRMTGQEDESFVIRDSFDESRKRLDYMGNVKVEAEGIGEKLSAEDYEIRQSAAGTPGGSVEISFRSSGRRKLGTAEKAVVIVKADTRINGTAGFGEAEQSIPNRAEAFFANSRQHLEKKSNEVHVYTGAIRLEKTESSGEKLDGVCFELYTKNKETYDPVIRRDGKVLTEKDEGYDPDGEVWQVVTKDGAAEFCGLGEDDGTKSRTYYLKEVRTAGAHSPAGAYLPVNLRRGLANGGKPVVVCNDPVQLLYAGGRGRLFFCLPAAAAAVVSAALLLRRKKKRKIVKR